jgi:ATP-dependent DNA helicase RecQ
MQFHGGYIFDGILDHLDNLPDDRRDLFRKLLESLSYFDVKSNLETQKEYTPEFAVLINILQRGLPTRLGFKAISMLAEVYDEIELKADNPVIRYTFHESVSSQKNFETVLFLIFHVIDPRLTSTLISKSFKSSWESLGSNYEEDFLFKILPDILNRPYLPQIVETQRSIQSITETYLEEKKPNGVVQNNFAEQKADFSIEPCYFVENESKGIVIEIDGQQHNEDNQQYLDTERDHAVAGSGWANTIRIKTSDFSNTNIKSKLNYLENYLEETTYFVGIERAYQKNFLTNEAEKRLLEICLSPIGIARIQRVMLEYIESGILSRFQSRWKIAIVERDVPCGYIALKDLLVQIENLFGLKNAPFPLPEIDLVIFATEEFENSPVHSLFYKVGRLKEWDSEDRFDLVIDISVLQRSGINEDLKTANKNLAVVRSSYHQYSSRTVKSSAFIKYPEIAVKGNKEDWIIDEDTNEKLLYFLQSVFRKKSFRPGQIPIISKALQGKSVIGLLPTGGGKSMTYQMSAFLQPGITMAVDPIKSLMKDQVDGLLKNYIDSSVYINSTQKGKNKQLAIKKAKSGYAQFVFISPERLQMEEFRNALTEMGENEHYFSFCVIDEAHCVSEWGHDFRTAYLRLGENAVKYCLTKSREPVTLFGLTATASFDVLSDVQRELSGNGKESKIDDDAIVRMENTMRPECQYVVEDVSFPEQGISTDWDMRKTLGLKKQERILRLIQEAPYKIESYILDAESCFADVQDIKSYHESIKIKDYDPKTFYENLRNAALIFCPHTKGFFGVTDRFKIDSRTGEPVEERNGVADIISKNNMHLKTGFFMGSSSDDEATKQEVEDRSIKSQDDFIGNKLNVLVATKAFGMGIDKENIRYTIHMNYPGSIESYVQEAGRAGRDRKVSISYILFNDQMLNIDGKDREVDLDHNLYFHKNSFKGESKELAILDELLNEIYFPDRSFELENVIHQKLDIDIKISYWEKESFKGLFVAKSFSEKLGYFNLANFKGVPKDSIDIDLSNQIFEIIKEYIVEQHPNVPVHIWIQQSDKMQGINAILKNKEVGERFALTLGFRNNGSERLKTITKWLTTVVHRDFNEAGVRFLRESTQGFKEFAEAVEQFYYNKTLQVLNLENHCLKRDQERSLEEGTTYQKFEVFYNGYRDKMDTEKAIYRLSTIGVIDDYVVNFAANTFTIYGIKLNDEKYVQNLKNYLLKYYSRKLTEFKLKQLHDFEGDSKIEKCLSFLISFVYAEIQSKRERAIGDMRTACHIGLKDGNIALKEYIDLYFNSKYARVPYTYDDIVSGKEINASLTELTDEGREPEDFNLLWKFIEIVERDKGSYIDNVKHLRGATTRMLRTQPDNYIFLLLNCFSIYQISFSSEKFLLEAEDLLQKGFYQISEKEDWSEDKLNKLYQEFITTICEKNPDLLSWMEKFGLVFDFDQVLVSRLLTPLSETNLLLSTLNSILSD